ncbi:MAG: lysine--tRNA ligase [Candidatus Methanomethylicota archaeon]|nr:MAG: lysine--tRNA ligase [Candidatus Verstraetearchaeota archaeon]
MTRIKPFRHWVDIVVEDLLSMKVDKHIVNGGMAASGPIHIGKTRGELFIQAAVARGLKKRGADVEHMLVVYTQDPLKAKPPLTTPEFTRKWKGIRILDVPCPEGCCSNWVEHWMKPFYEVLDDFGIENLKVVETSELYKDRRMVNAVKLIIEKRNKAREVLSRFKGAKYPEDWIPFKPLCPNCHNISTTKAISVDLEAEKVEFTCPRCGVKGKVDLTQGKLEWRLEWAALWKVLNVTFEPYGKDHAVAGGSRDSCAAIAKEVLGIQPPKGLAYEWVYVNGKAMSSSGGISFDFNEWPKIAKPQVLKYWYYSAKPMTHLDFSPIKVPQLSDEYDKAERVYFGIEKVKESKIEENMKRSYEIANNEKPPKEMPIQIPYKFAVMLAQIIPEKEGFGWRAAEKLIKTGHLHETPSEGEIKQIESILRRAGYWARKYAPPHLRITILEKLPQEIVNKLSEKEKEFLRILGEKISERTWMPDELEAEIYRLAREVVGIGSKRAFKAAYRVLLGRESGPRLAPFILTLDEKFVIKRFTELS